jgi:hypothetical protein
MKKWIFYILKVTENFGTDLHPAPFQNVTDPEHYFYEMHGFCYEFLQRYGTVYCSVIAPQLIKPSMIRNIQQAFVLVARLVQILCTLLLERLLNVLFYCYRQTWDSCRIFDCQAI